MLDAKEIITKLHKEHTASGIELLELLRSEDIDTMEVLRQAAKKPHKKLSAKLFICADSLSSVTFAKTIACTVESVAVIPTLAVIALHRRKF